MSRPIRRVLHPESLRLIGIPKSFRNMTLNDYEAKNKGLKEVKALIADYISNIDSAKENNKGLLLCGSNGVGKSMLSCIILKEAYRHRYTSRRTTFVEYIDKYTRVWSAKSQEEKSNSEEELYTYFKGAEFLVLDELGKEIDSKVATPILEDLLRYREDNGLVTIICTNLNFSVLSEKYGASCMSLFKGNLIPVVIESTDRRVDTFRKRKGE